MTVRPENLSQWSSIWPNLQSGQLLYRVHQAASANCLNFQKLAGQAALKIVKTSDKTPNIVNFIIPVGIPLKKLRPEKFENTNDKMQQNEIKRGYIQSKIRQTKMLVTCQRFGDMFSFGLVWQYSTNQNQYNRGNMVQSHGYLLPAVI